ncbi:MAG: ester cyclase [Beduini sp.]|uniref:ester cyclase n=1 Tax=Beduini sp. TaxID=1922300 RepID=UPI0011CAA654
MEKKEIIRYFYEEVVSKNLIDELPQYVAEECEIRVGDQNFPLGIEGMKTHLIEVKKTYPDYTMTLTRQYVDNDYVISEFIMEGTHKGEWIGIKPTHKRLKFTGVDIDKVVDGKIVEHGGAVNTFDTLFEHHLIQPTPKEELS